jgi:glycosyltransferase involved in cell wall biosynthesis
MHTDPQDPYGQDLDHIINHLGVNSGQILLSREKVGPDHLSMMYNIADCTINISDAEGFGLATLESLYCGTPIIVTMTGGLQEQVTDGKEWFGIGLEPSSKALIGSQQVPYIFEDRINGSDFIEALEKMYNMDEEERRAMGLKGQNHVASNYSFENYEKRWVEIMDEVNKENGSWENRKNYSPWTLQKMN